MKNAILFFVKYPQAGKVKTRLAKTLGDEQASLIYRQLALRNFNVLRLVRESDLIVMFDPPEKEEAIKQWLQGASAYRAQKGLDLGERLEGGFKDAFSYGYRKVVAVGSDILDLTADRIEESLGVLAGMDVVIGPATDGGYYLLGASAHHPQLFKNITWSTAVVLDETILRIKAANLKFGVIATLDDLDEIKEGEKYEFV